MICDVIENKDTEFVKVKTETLENDILNIDEKNNEQIQIDPLSDSNIKLEQFDENLVSEEIDPFCDIKSEQFDGSVEVNNIQSEIVINLEIQ